MAKRRFGTFTGGIDLPDDKDATLEATIVPVGPLARLSVPLAPADAEPARPVIEAGQYVTRGGRLAEGGAGQVDVFAPLAGRVAGFDRVRLPGSPGRWRDVPAIVLAETIRVSDIQPLPSRYEWQAADGPSIRHRIAEGGLTTFREPVVALSEWIASADRAGADTLIANFMENTPFITADHRLLAERGSEVIRGLAILARALGIKDVMLVVDHRRTDQYRSAVGPARLYGIESIALAHKYPIGADVMLTKVLTRRTVRPGQAPLAVGAAVVDAGTCWATYRWVACGELPTSRIVTVSGPGVGRCGNVLVPFGASCAEVLAAAQSPADEPAVHGSAMSGRQLADGSVVGPACNALLAPQTPQLSPPGVCIRCGWCVDNCPARLNVAGLNDDFELGRDDRARRRGALACVDCGICSYVCPARLPLACRVGMLKGAIRDEGARAARSEPRPAKEDA